MPEEVIEEIYQSLQEGAAAPAEELEALYSPSEDEKRIAWQAISDHEDFGLFKLAPEPGGLDDQPLDWIEGVRTVERAKSWADAIRRARQDVDSALSGDPENRDQGRVQEATGELEKLEARHRKVLDSMRPSRKKVSLGEP